MNVMVQDQLTS